MTATIDGRRPSGASSAVWFVILAGFVVLAVTGPVKMATREERGNGGGDVVHMAGLRFNPDSLVVPRGTTVRFDNDDVAPHTVTSNDQSIDSGTLRPGATFTLVVNTRFEYFCAIHPSMTAAVEIEA